MTAHVSSHLAGRLEGWRGVGLATKSDDTTGKERHVLADLVPLWWERRLHRTALFPLQDRCEQRRRNLAGLLFQAR
ncbi:hypothetical protein D9M68_952320 [compost metagenome]